ncbi:MAG: hypothetical protein A2Z14_05870 [Chloroflexi bacterium RBG_16_48_8]|nr:MAG: hypothetical protein A2Z14_05870 [Chloroflexi bacterium RBG_16_48_8]
MGKLKFELVLMLSAFLLIGCSVAQAPETVADQSFGGDGLSREVLMADSDTAVESQSSTSNDSGGAPPIEPLVIRNANLTLVVEDPSKATDDIANLAESLGGFVVNSNVYQTTYGTSDVLTTRASITIRVPVERLNEALDKIIEGAIEVQEKSISGQDVTREYTDLQSRLRNLEAAEEQLREIMDAATKTEDVLRVFEDLRMVREEIEVIKGQINYYEDAAQLSAISMELIPDELAQPLSIGKWRLEGTVKDAVEALINALRFLIKAGIWLVICVLPILLLFGIPGFFIGRSVLRQRGKKQIQSPEEEKVADEG